MEFFKAFTGRGRREYQTVIDTMHELQIAILEKQEKTAVAKFFIELEAKQKKKEKLFLEKMKDEIDKNYLAVQVKACIT